ncbi:uncharacterized protein [Dysidea avara]
MKYSNGHSKWLLLLLTFSLLNQVAVSVWSRQVIAVLGNDQEIQKAANFLLNRNKGNSQAVKLDTDIVQLDPLKQTFQRVKWDTETEKFVSDKLRDKLPTNWKDAQIQIVGHGDIYSEKIGNLLPGGLAKKKNQLTHNSDVGKISIVACSGSGSPTDTAPPYLEAFLKQLDHPSTPVSIRSALVSVDSQGHILTGELVLDKNGNLNGIKWSRNDPSKKWIGKYDGNKVEITQKLATDEAELESYYYGVLPESAPIYVKTKGNSNAYGLNDQESFSWVDKIAKDTYKNINGRGGTLAEHQVHILPNKSPMVLQVREIGGIDDLLKELRYHGENGPGTNANAKEYYRFGDWVLGMRLDTFYVDVEGIIVTSTDSDGKKEQVNEYKTEWKKVPAPYGEMRKGIDEAKFIEEVRHWMNGEHGKIGLNMESAFHAQCGMAMFMAESIRCFHNHFTNMMSLQLIEKGYMNVDLLFNTHPMARGGTWQVEYSEGENKGRKKTGLSLLEDDNAAYSNLNDKNIFESISQRISRISKTWLSHSDTQHLSGSWDPPPKTTVKEYSSAPSNLLQSVESIGKASSLNEKYNYLRQYDLSQTGPLLSTAVTEPGIEAIDNQIEEFSATEDIASPVQASLALANDQAYISELITEEVESREEQTGKEYEIQPDSIVAGDTENSIKFKVRDKSNPRVEEEITVEVDEEKMSSKNLLEELKQKGNGVKEEPLGGSLQERASRINRGLAIYGVARGLLGSIGALEDGNVEQGAIGLAQSLHGIGELTGVNKAIYRQSGKILGNLLRNDVESVDTAVSTISGESAERLLVTSEGEVLSTVGRVGELMEDIPIIGTAFGIYNIYEDFQQHTVIGYIDGGLDIAITGLGFLGPETEPVILALTVVRMTIDTFYADISKELNNLPSDASVGQKIGAVFKGIVNAGVDLWKEFTLGGQIFGAIDSSHKLDRQHQKDEEYLIMLSNYQNYFTVVKENGSSATEINFAGGLNSLYGGDITFHLGESGTSTLSLETVNSQGDLTTETQKINTANVEDIVMGIGESEKVSFKTEKVKFLWFIPVHSQRVISGTTRLRESLHGTYYGNSRNNKFIAVQELPPNADLGFTLTEYYYRLCGGAGDDSFYLGPQHSYVEGNDGADAYFINKVAVHTEINNYATDDITDHMIFQINYNQITAQRHGLDLQMYSMDGDTCTHDIKICNWFLSVSYQHLVFKTKDGVLFKISATNMGEVELIPYGLSGVMAINATVYDTREHEYSQVVSVVGSRFDDIIYGNDMSQNFDGGEGQDKLEGGNGRDTYTVSMNEGVDIINNYATDGMIDTLILGCNVDDIDIKMQSSDLKLTKRGSTLTGATITNWFRDEKHRHMIFVSEDGVVFNVSSSHSPSLQPIFVDMSLRAPIRPPGQTQSAAIITEVNLCGRNLDYKIYLDRQIDLSLDPLLSNVVTVFGSNDNDYISGNHKGNYISAGKGRDYLEGGDGQDVYVIKEGDGFVIINNYADDNMVDTILFGANCVDIKVKLQCGTLVLAAHETNPIKMIKILIVNWFHPLYQHLLVRSIDGIVFELPRSVAGHQSTIAKTIDFSKVTSDNHIRLTGKWSHVERVIGSNGGRDTIIGNALNNYLNPGEENCYLQGNDGGDTYVIDSSYGKHNVIYNHAEDDSPDTLRFPVPYFSISAFIQGRDIQLTSNTTNGCVNVKLKDYYTDNKTRHLTVLTDDGISFVIPPSTNYKPVPLLINRATTTTGQHINLTAIPDYAEVRTVQGSSNHQNCIIGNSQHNTIVGGSAPDGLYGLDGDDILKGGGGDDMLFGGPGADTLAGGSGDDQLNGEEGDDVISPGIGSNHVNGGPGSDTVIYGGTLNGIDLNLASGTCMHDGNDKDNLTSIENAYGTVHNDILLGDENDNILVGQGGVDHLVPGSGYDILNGGNGNDTYNLTAANGTVTIQNYADDEALDKIIMTYTNTSNLVIERSIDDLVIEVINVKYPVFIDGSKPSVVIKGWYVGSLYRHAYIEAEDGTIQFGTLEQLAKDVTS